MTQYEISPLTPQLWDDLETLFGPNGACAGCWCMYWHLPRKIYDCQTGEANRMAFKSLVEQGPPPGLLAYNENLPIGWIALAPRSTYPALERSRVLKPIDDKPVWSIVCFYIAKKSRKMGVTKALILASIDYARSQNGEILEAYPIDPLGKKYPPAFAYTGFYSTFIEAGFQEVARRSATRPIVRYYL